MSCVLRLTLTQGCGVGLSQPHKSDSSCNEGDTHFSRWHMIALSMPVWHSSFLLSLLLPPDSWAKILNCQIPWTNFRPGHPWPGLWVLDIMAAPLLLYGFGIRPGGTGVQLCHSQHCEQVYLIRAKCEHLNCKIWLIIVSSSEGCSQGQMKSFVKHLAQCLKDKRHSRNIHYHYLLKNWHTVCYNTTLPGFSNYYFAPSPSSSPISMLISDP